MSTPEVSVRFYRPGDEGGILRVLHESFARWPEVEVDASALDHLRWKIGDHTAPERHTVAEVGGEIVGVRLGLVQRYKLRDEHLLRSLEADSAVLPEFRGCGIYSGIVRFGVEKFVGRDFIVSSTGRESLSQLDRDLGHRPIGNRFCSLRCDLVGAAIVGTHTDDSIREIEAFDDRIERFWKQAASAFDLIAWPSKDELNWRYCDARSGHGRVLQAEEQGEIVGFAALRVSRGAGSLAYLLALPGRLDIARALVRRSLARFREMNVRQVACALPSHHPYTTLLVEEGFTQKSHVIPLTSRPVREGLDLSFLREAKASVHFMLGDTDLV